MSTVDTSPSKRRAYWLYFLISTAALIAMLIFADEWFWIALPFSLTYFVMALGDI